MKLKTKDLFLRGDVESGVAHLINSHAVGLRHKFLDVLQEANRKKKAKRDSFDDIFEQDKPTETNEYLKFNNITFPCWLSNLPKEWTVIHITEFHEAMEVLKLFGPPARKKTLPNLAVIRFPCGRDHKSFLLKEVSQPWGACEGSSLLGELEEILEGNRTVGTNYKGNRTEYWKIKQAHHDQLKVIVFISFK